jgi:hypothetical protein
VRLWALHRWRRADQRCPVLLLCADRRFDNQQVLFALRGSVGSPQYELEIVFLPDRQDLGCDWA